MLYNFGAKAPCFVKIFYQFLPTPLSPSALPLIIAETFGFR
jgi:hypothetical protein